MVAAVAAVPDILLLVLDQEALPEVMVEAEEAEALTIVKPHWYMRLLRM